MIPSGLLPKRSPDAHKGDMGHVFVIAGSVGLSGAAYLCSMGALRTGAGLVTLGMPESLKKVMAVKLSEVMTRPLAETKQGSIALGALPEILGKIESVDSVALGPGLSQETQTKEMVRQLLPRLVKPCVVDADGLNAIADDTSVLSRLAGKFVITPHPGEMARLIKLSAKDVGRDRERIASEFAKKYGVVVALKGHKSVVANIDGEVYINETGNPAMASGGMGDVLTGMIAALLAQGLSIFDAARLGVYLHGLAGDLAEKEIGSVGLIATDLVYKIPHAVSQYQAY